MKPFKLMAATSLVAMLMSAQAYAADVVLKYSSFLPLNHFITTDVIIPWGKEVERVTEGRVKFDVLPKIVGTPPSQYDVVADGLADISWVNPGYTPGRFAAISLGELPFLSEDPEIASVAFYRFYDKHVKPLNIFKEVEVLTVFGSTAGQFFTRGSTIDSLASLKGKKLRAPVQTTTATLEAVGAVPIQKPYSEIFELLSTGAIDGSVSGLEQAVSFKLADVCDHLTIVPGGLHNGLGLLVVNKDTWAKISDADKKAINDITGEKFARTMGQSFLEPVKAALQHMKDKGHKVITASPEFVEELKQATRSVEDMVKAKAKADSGMQDPDAVMVDYRAIIAQVTKEKTGN